MNAIWHRLHPPLRQSVKKRFAFILTLLLVTAFLVWRWGLFDKHIHLSTPEIMGGVVRTEGESGGRIYYLTSQWEKQIHVVGGGRSSYSTRTEGWLNVDLWELDAATAQPVARRRIRRDKVNGDAKALGVEQGILWARIPELVGIRLSDGEIVANAAKIEARNPKLAGMIPQPPPVGTFLTESMQPLKFSPQTGMVVRLNDARLVRFDPLTLEATPGKEITTPAKPGPEGSAPTFGTSVVSLSNGMDWWAMVRGLAIQMPSPDKGGQWLGLLAEQELAQMQERHTVTQQMDFSVPRRHKLYRAEIKTTQEFLGPQVSFENPTVLPESPDFLMAGLLTQGSGGTSGQSAMWRTEPDSVFVLSRDRLGQGGHLQLARISGPNGTPVWSNALPLSDMSAWLPGERCAVMLGPDLAADHSPMAEDGENTVPQVVSIDLKTGEVKSFNLDLHRDWPVQGNPEGKK